MTVSVEQRSQDSTSPTSKAFDAFQVLAQHLSLSVDISSEGTFAGIDPEPIIRAMKDYNSKESEWARYAHEDSSQCFTRNLVDRGNGKSNLVHRLVSSTFRADVSTDRPSKLVLVWTPGLECPIHDHTGSHCIMKVLISKLESIESTKDEDRYSKGH